MEIESNIIQNSEINTDIYEFIQYIIRSYYINNNKLGSKEDIDNEVSKIYPTASKKYQISTKRRSRKVIPENEQCMGRKLDNHQCTRRRLPNSEFCKSHRRKCPYGRYDEENIVSKVKAKRGRKRKVEFDERQINPEYVTLWEDIVNGDKCLVDIKGNVYTFDLEHPKFLGKKSLEGKIE